MNDNRQMGPNEKNEAKRKQMMSFLGNLQIMANELQINDPDIEKLGELHKRYCYEVANLLHQDFIIMLSKKKGGA
jgi:hypothetical protein